MSISQLESPRFKSVLTGGSGLVNAGGFVYIYEVGGNYLTGQVTVWSDKAKTTPLSQPVELDSAGEAQIWFDGTVDIRVEDSATAELYTMTGIESSPTATITGNYNLVQNGSFEIDSDNDGAPDSWTLAPATSATIAIDATSGGQANGSNGLKFTSNGTECGSATSDIFSVSDGETISAEWYFKVEDATIDASTNTVVIYWYDYAGNAHGTPSTPLWSIIASAPASWTKYTATAVVPTGATQAKIVINGVVSGGVEAPINKSVWFDNVEVVNEAPNRVVDTVQTPTTTSADFTSIPAWITSITIVLESISVAGASNLTVILGDEDGLDTDADYQHTVHELDAAPTMHTATNGTDWHLNEASLAVGADIHGRVHIEKMTGEIWQYTAHVNDSNAGKTWLCVGNKTLAKTLDRLRVYASGTFDAGTVKVYYE